VKTVPARAYSIAAVDRAAAVLGVLDGRPSRSLTEVARATGLSETTALRYLSSLAGNGLVERDELSGHYRLGLRLFGRGFFLLSRFRSFLLLSRLAVVLLGLGVVFLGLVLVGLLVLEALLLQRLLGLVLVGERRGVDLLIEVLAGQAGSACCAV